MRFHVDACPPHSTRIKGKVERRIRDQRRRSDPHLRPWDHLEELRAMTDEEQRASTRRQICPSAETSIEEAFAVEKPQLSTLARANAW